MHRISFSHLVKPRTTSPLSHKVILQHKPVHPIRQTHSDVSLSKFSFATSNILSTQQSRTNFEIPTTTIYLNVRNYFNRRRPKRKSKTDQSAEAEEQADEESQHQQQTEPEFTAKYKSLPEFNTFFQKALSLLDTDPMEAMANAAMAFETLNSVTDKTRLAEGFLSCKEIMATCHLRVKDYETAQKCIDDMLRISPNSFRAFLKRGRIYYETGDYKQANEWFAKAIKEIPTEPKTYIRRAYALIKLGKVDEAHELIDQALRLIGDDDGLLYWKALALSGLQQHEQASQVLDLALVQPDAVLDCHRLKAMVLQDAGKFDEAAQAAEVGVQKIQKMERPDDKLLNTLWSIQGACYVSVGKFKDAIESLQHLPPSTQTNLTLGQCYYEFREYQIAMDFFDQAISLAATPNEQAIGRFRKALCLFHLNSKQEAKLQFEEAIELGLTNYYLEFFTAKGHKAMELQKAPEVLALIQEMAGPDYKDVRVQVIRAIVLMRTGKIGEAVRALKDAVNQGCDPAIIKDLEKAAMMESGTYAVQRMVEAQALQSTDAAQAIDIYEKILKSIAGINSAVIYKACVTELAKSYMKTLQYDRAEKCAQLAVDSGDASAWLLLADAQFYQGKFKQCLQSYDYVENGVPPVITLTKKKDEQKEEEEIEDEIDKHRPKFEPLFSHKEMEKDQQKVAERVAAFNPDFANALLNKATALFTMREFTKSVATCQKLEEVLTNIAKSHVNTLKEGIGASEVENQISIPEAIKQAFKQGVASDAEIQQAVSIVEASTLYLVKMFRLQALNFQSLGKPELTETAYDKCIEIQPSLDNFQQKIRFLMDQKRYEEVIQTCEQAMQAELSKEECRELLDIEARIFMLMKDYKGAIGTFQRLLKLSKAKWRVLFNIGKSKNNFEVDETAVLYRRMGFIDQALKVLNESLTYRTSTQIPAEYLRGISLEKARCFLTLESFDRAAKNLEDFISISQKEKLPLKHGFTLLWNLAYCYYQLNNFGRMQEIAAGLVRRFPSNPVSHYVMGLALQGLEKHGEALQFFDKSLELKPDQLDVVNAKTRLVQRLAGLSSAEGLQMSTPPQVSLEQ